MTQGGVHDEVGAADLVFFQVLADVVADRVGAVEEALAADVVANGPEDAVQSGTVVRRRRINERDQGRMIFAGDVVVVGGGYFEERKLSERGGKADVRGRRRSF